LNGNLNYDASRGTIVVPWLAWGPYLWADGTNPRSDGFTWPCSDLQADFTHPSPDGRNKVGTELLAFFKTDATSVPWFLKKAVVGQVPVCAPSADLTNGLAPLAVTFSANASDADGPIRDYQWTFDDGTFSTNANPQKIFFTAGTYQARLTVTDGNGNTARGTVMVTVRGPGATLGSLVYEGDQFQCSVSGPANLEHVVEATTDLMAWRAVKTNRGPFTFTDTTASNYPARFFRAFSRP
jgi:PKD repeat protein